MPPEPPETIAPVASYELIRMPDSTGVGDYSESSQVITVRYQGQAGSYTQQMFVMLVGGQSHPGTPIRPKFT